MSTKKGMLLLAVVVIVAIASNILLWHDLAELRTHAKDQPSSRERAGNKENLWLDNFMCPRANWCGVDFTRLAAHPRTVSGKRLFILGYLAVDGGIVSLFARKEDYIRLEYGRSLEVGGDRHDLVALIQAHGNSYVRLEGTYRLPELGPSRSGRLGTLEPPIEAFEFQPRAFEQGPEDIGVRVRYLDESATEK